MLAYIYKKAILGGLNVFLGAVVAVEKIAEKIEGVHA